MCLNLFKSSLGRKQIVAVTGLMLIIFLLGHLAGNLLIFLGPEVFNGYAKKLAGLRPGLYLVEIALGFVFLIHVGTTVYLVCDNIRAAGISRYAVKDSRGERPWSTKLRTYTGLFIFVFLIWHLIDFTFIDHDGIRGVMGHKNLGLYGIVYNSFLNPVHSILYIIAMGCIGFHLAHGVQSCMQTLGFNHPKYTPMVKNISNWFSFFVACAFSSIPLFVLIRG